MFYVTGSKSLDNLMLDLFTISKQQEFSIESFKNIAKKYIPNGIDNELSDFINAGKTIDLQNVISSLPFEKIKMGIYERGFDKKSFVEENVIGTVNKGIIMR